MVAAYGRYQSCHLVGGGSTRLKSERESWAHGSGCCTKTYTQVAFSNGRAGSNDVEVDRDGDRRSRSAVVAGSSNSHLGLLSSKGLGDGHLRLGGIRGTTSALGNDARGREGAEEDGLELHSDGGREKDLDRQ